MSNYRNGADLERAARKSLEADGYYVIRSAGSKGVVDLAAFKPGETLFVQCKLDGYLEPLERMALIDLSTKFGVTALVARWSKVGREARQVAFRYYTAYGKGGFDWYADEWRRDDRAHV